MKSKTAAPREAPHDYSNPSYNHMPVTPVHLSGTCKVGDSKVSLQRCPVHKVTRNAGLSALL